MHVVASGFNHGRDAGQPFRLTYGLMRPASPLTKIIMLTIEKMKLSISIMPVSTVGEVLHLHAFSGQGKQFVDVQDIKRSCLQGCALMLRYLQLLGRTMQQHYYNTLAVLCRASRPAPGAKSVARVLSRELHRRSRGRRSS